MGCRSDRAVWIVSAGPDREGVKVVGEDRPGGPGVHSNLSLQSGSPQPVAALEVTDPALGSCAVSAESPLGSFGAGLLAAGDEHTVGCNLFERFGGGLLLEAPVERDLPWSQPEPLEFCCCVGEQLVLGRVARRHGRREDESAGSTLGVLCDLADLQHVAELVRLAELALAD